METLEVDDRLKKFLAARFNLHGEELQETAQDCWVDFLHKGVPSRARHWGLYKASAFSTVTDNFRKKAAKKRGNHIKHLPLHVVGEL